MASLELSNVVKRFGSVEVIHGVDLSVDDGEFVVFVGPSGCGKSTLLRMIAWLEPITSGDVLIGGELVNDATASHIFGADGTVVRDAGGGPTARLAAARSRAEAAGQ